MDAEGRGWSVCFAAERAAEAGKRVCNSWAERVGVSGEMSGGLALNRFLKVLQVDAFDAGSRGSGGDGCARERKNAIGTRFCGRG